MGKPYSLDLRERIVAYALAGHSARAAARVFGVSPSTAIRLVSEHRRGGNIAPKRQGRAPGTVGKLAPHVDYRYKSAVDEGGVEALFERTRCKPNMANRVPGARLPMPSCTPLKRQSLQPTCSTIRFCPSMRSTACRYCVS